MPVSGMNVGGWTATIVGAIVLIVIVAALMPTLTTNLATYNGTEHTLGPVLVKIVPILIGIALLLVFVFEFLPTGGHGSRYSRHKRR